MGGAKIVVYGLSTEGYSLACQMAIKGADVQIIDETTPSAISIKADIAKTYPNVSSFKEDEPLLAMEPIDIAVSKAQYLFFTPRIRKTGQDTKTEVHSKFKDATSQLKKGSSVIYNLGTGFGGKNEKKFVAISSSEHFHAINILSRFSGLCSVLEVCKFALDDNTKSDLTSDTFNDIFLDDMINSLK